LEIKFIGAKANLLNSNPQSLHFNQEYKPLKKDLKMLKLQLEIGLKEYKTEKLNVKLLQEYGKTSITIFQQNYLHVPKYCIFLKIKELYYPGIEQN